MSGSDWNHWSSAQGIIWKLFPKQSFCFNLLAKTPPALPLVLQWPELFKSHLFLLNMTLLLCERSACCNPSGGWHWLKATSSHFGWVPRASQPDWTRPHLETEITITWNSSQECWNLTRLFLKKLFFWKAKINFGSETTFHWLGTNWETFALHKKSILPL